jgi:hypothetical protein
MRLPALALLALAVAARAQTPQLSLHGDHTGDGFGSALAVTDDLDGDGVPDLLIGAPAAPGTASAPGYARVLSGKDGSLLMRLLGQGADQFGASVAAAGDVDGDGLRDLLVGNPGAAGPQSATDARLFSSHDGHLLAVLPGLSFADSWDAFGHAVADLGDLTGDGVPDFGVGGPSLSGEQPGFVRLYDGATATPINALVGEDFGDEFGFSLASPGDVNLDGTPDILVGALGGDYAELRTGVDGTLLLTLPGAPGGGFASAVSGAGDIDGDGTPDLAIGIPLFNRVDVLSGASGALLRHFEKLGGEFGTSIAPLGDVNGDGSPDLLVGAPGDTIVALAGAGAAYAISGSTGQNLFKFAGSVAGARLGTAVAAADLDGDGRKEPLIGAPLDAAPGGAGAGTARIYAGDLPGSIVNYGQGCPGSFLITPRLDLFGDPLAGGLLTLSVSKALGGAPALLALGGGPDLLPLANGCILWMSPLVSEVGFVMDGGFPGAGTKLFSGRLPNDMPVGFSFALQVLIADDGTDGGVSGTSAFEVTVQ